MLSLLRRLAVIEAVSYLLLLVATAVKYTSGNELGVKVLGPIHGMLFLAYAALIVIERSDHGWTIGQVLLMLIAGSLPFGGFWVDRRYLAPSAATATASG